MASRTPLQHAEAYFANLDAIESVNEEAIALRTANMDEITRLKAEADKAIKARDSFLSTYKKSFNDIIAKSASNKKARDNLWQQVKSNLPRNVPDDLNCVKSKPKFPFKVPLHAPNRLMIRLTWLQCANPYGWNTKTAGKKVKKYLKSEGVYMDLVALMGEGKAAEETADAFLSRTRVTAFVAPGEPSV